MELTHAQVREMIQFDADFSLSADSLRILKSHLASCDACRTYSDSIHTMEGHLRHAMTKRWNLRPAPLALDAIKSKSFSNSTQLTQLATRLTLVATVALMVVVTALGITNAAKENERDQAPLVVPLIPTPSLQTTVTLANTVQSCDWIRYEVQPKDTLADIAEQFSIAKDELMEANKLGSETVIAGSELTIPLCNSTPTSTVHPPTFTTTITPLTEAISQTPDG
jgi:LysM repeat protein